MIYYIFKLRALLSSVLLTASLTLVASGCDSDFERQWDVPVVDGRYQMVRQESFAVESIVDGVEKGSGWLALSANHADLIFGFDSADSVSLSYMCSARDLSDDFSEGDITLNSELSIILNCKKTSSQAVAMEIRRFDDGKLIWAYNRSQDDGYIRDIVYADSDLMIVSFIPQIGGVIYGFLDAKTGELIKKSEDALIGENFGFNRAAMSLYVSRRGWDRTKDSFVMSYDYETNSFKDLAIIPNDFSGQKMTISIQPELSFSNERYLVLSISSGGRGITFAGFIVVDTRTGEYLYNDYFEGGPPFQFVANNEGDLVVIKHNSDARTSLVTHLRFN